MKYNEHHSVTSSLQLVSIRSWWLVLFLQVVLPFSATTTMVNAFSLGTSSHRRCRQSSRSSSNSRNSRNSIINDFWSSSLCLSMADNNNNNNNQNTKKKKKKNTTFPFSTRAALIKKAKELDTNLAQGKRIGSYSSSGWSNRLGTVLTPVATTVKSGDGSDTPVVYTADRPFYWNNIDVGCRMTIIQLQNNSGDLFIHSPVTLDKQLQQAIETEFGGTSKVKYIIASNYEHVKYTSQWHQTYPNAYMWGCPGLIERMPEISWTGGEIPKQPMRLTNDSMKKSSNSSSSNDDKCWDLNEIQPLFVDMEVNPFTGKPFFNEVIYYHIPSKTLLTTDLYWNYPTPNGVPNSFLIDDNDHVVEDTDIDDPSTIDADIITEWELAPAVDSIPCGSKVWKFGMDQIFLPFYKYLMIKNKSKYEEMIHIILNEWDIETLIPAHGDIIRGKSTIRKILKQHLTL